MTTKTETLKKTFNNWAGAALTLASLAVWLWTDKNPILGGLLVASFLLLAWQFYKKTSWLAGAWKAWRDKKK